VEGKGGGEGKGSGKGEKESSPTFCSSLRPWTVLNVLWWSSLAQIIIIPIRDLGRF